MSKTSTRKVTYGLRDLVIWFAGDEYATPYIVPGVINYNRTMNTTTADQYADDKLYFRLRDEKNGDSTLSLVDIPDEIKARMLGWRIDERGGLVHVKDAKPERFHMAFGIDSDAQPRRKLVYGCEAAIANDNNETRGENVSFRNEEAAITEYGIDLNGEHIWDYTVNKGLDPEGYAKSLTEVVYPQAGALGVVEPDDATLSSLTIGSLELTPSFAADVDNYTATTTNATNTVSATATDEDAEVSITVNGTAHVNGASATWETGENQVVVRVTNGSTTETYTVKVTKSE